MADATSLAPRPTTYKGVQMRSRLEAAWAEQFDAAGITWEYEPQCYASAEGQYLPDFQLTDAPFPVFVEVKPWIDVDQLYQVLFVEAPRASRILAENIGDCAFLLAFGATSAGDCRMFAMKETSTGEHFALPTSFLSCPPVPSLHAKRFL